jgi:four helix bundle protein
LQIANFKLQIVSCDGRRIKAVDEAVIVASYQARRRIAKTIEGRAIAKQLVRSGTSVAANYRAACRARSRSEFVAKMAVVLEEADETQLWLELIIESKLRPIKRVEPLLGEVTELVAIFVASRKSAFSNLRSTT